MESSVTFFDVTKHILSEGIRRRIVIRSATHGTKTSQGFRKDAWNENYAKIDEARLKKKNAQVSRDIAAGTESVRVYRLASVRRRNDEQA